MTKINFTGNIDEVKRQIEQSVATYELLGNRSSIDFEQWFARWESGFTDAVENRSLGNYPLTGEKAWRSDVSKWPRWRQWSNNNGIIEGEYWRDRSKEADSIPLSGTADQLIEHIIQLEYTGKGSVQEKEAEFTGGGEVKRQGKPRLYTYFTEDEADIEPGYDPIRGKISMRLMDKTKATLTTSDLNRYTTRLQTVFGVNGGKIWRRGKDMANYTDWENGYQLQLLVRSKTEGEELIKNFLAIQNVPFVKKKYFYNENQDTVNAYPTDPGEEVVLGKKVKKARYRPIAEVRFESAWISFGSNGKRLYLVDLTGDNKIFSD